MGEEHRLVEAKVESPAPVLCLFHAAHAFTYARALEESDRAAEALRSAAERYARRDHTCEACERWVRGEGDAAIAAKRGKP